MPLNITVIERCKKFCDKHIVVEVGTYLGILVDDAFEICNKLDRFIMFGEMQAFGPQLESD